MKCNASPTTSTAADVARTRAVTTLADALLFRAILKPLAAGLGPVGETALDAVADRIAQVPS